MEKRFHTEVIDELPEAVTAGLRQTDANTVYSELLASGTGKLKVTGENDEEIDRLYRTLIQWRTRHRDKGVGIRKLKNEIYLWLGEPPPGGRTTRVRQARKTAATQPKE